MRRIERVVTGRRHRTTTLWLTVLLAVVYLVLGISGVVLPGSANATHGTGPHVLVFSTNALLGVLHLAIGSAGAFAAVRPPLTSLYGAALFVVALGLTAYGSTALIAGANPGDVLDVNWADNILHLLTAGAGAALWTLRETPRTAD